MTDRRRHEGKKTAPGKGERQVKGQIIPEIVTNHINQHCNTESMGKDKQGLCVRMGDIK